VRHTKWYSVVARARCVVLTSSQAHTMSNFFTDGSKGDLKDAISHKTLEKVREYAKHINLELSAEAATRTIKGTLEAMLTFQTTLWWDVKGGHGRPIGVIGASSPFLAMCAELIFGCLHIDGGAGGTESSSSDGAGGGSSSSSVGAGSSSGGASDIPAQLGQVASAVLVEGSLVNGPYIPGLRTMLTQAGLLDRYDDATKSCADLGVETVVDLHEEMVWQELSTLLQLKFTQKAKLQRVCADDTLLRSFAASDSGHASKRRRL
jgi:hypothetical protein